MNKLAFISAVDPLAIWLPVVSMLLIVLFLGMAYWTFFKKCPPETVFVRMGAGSTKVAYSGLMVMPIMHHLETVSLAQHQLEFNIEDELSGRIWLLKLDIAPGPMDLAFAEIAQNIGGKASCDAEKLKAKLEPIVSKEVLEMLQLENELNPSEEQISFENQIEKQLSGKLLGYQIQKLAILETENSNTITH